MTLPKARDPETAELRRRIGGRLDRLARVRRLGAPQFIIAHEQREALLLLADLMGRD